MRAEAPHCGSRVWGAGDRSLRGSCEDARVLLCLLTRRRQPAREAVSPARGGGTAWSWRSGRRGQTETCGQRRGREGAEAHVSFPALSFVLKKKKHNYVGSTKECLNYHTTALISRASKVMLKILEARLQQRVNSELPDVQAGFRKGRGARDQIPNIRWLIEKAREFQKNIYFCFIDYTEAFD